VPELWKNEKIDYCIHIGMATGRKYYSIERRAHRDGYLMRDVDNQLLDDDTRRRKQGTDWIWDGLPSDLLSAIDVDDVWKRWRLSLPDIDLRISEDAGRYLCDFIYYSSLAHLRKTAPQKLLNVLFLHVPADASEKAIQTGVDATLDLVRAVVVSGELRRLIDLKMQRDSELSVPVLGNERDSKGVEFNA
jgi:pyroglutamyl-peptidase